MSLRVQPLVARDILMDAMTCLFASDAGLRAMRLLEATRLRFGRDSLVLSARGGRPGSGSGIMSVERHSLRPMSILGSLVRLSDRG
jgi:hypothetical protein